MPRRLTRSIFAAGVCSLLVISASAQSHQGPSPTRPKPTTTSEVRLKPDTTYAPPRTAWGDPDLQGTWSYNDDVDTPFERAGGLGAKAEFGDEELAAVLEERAR